MRFAFLSREYLTSFIALALCRRTATVSSVSATSPDPDMFDAILFLARDILILLRVGIKFV